VEEKERRGEIEYEEKGSRRRKRQLHLTSPQIF
jgi:hypothetical protein